MQVPPREVRGAAISADQLEAEDQKGTIESALAKADMSSALQAEHSSQSISINPQQPVKRAHPPTESPRAPKAKKFKKSPDIGSKKQLTLFEVLKRPAST